MKKTITTILFVTGMALIVAGVSLQAFPQWWAIPGGVLLLVTAAFLGIAGLGEKLKGWRDFLFGDEGQKEKTQSGAQPDKAPRRPSKQTQEMTGSENGEQTLRHHAGIQEQKMTDSPGGKQRIE